jgi:hypothetical protein
MFTSSTPIWHAGAAGYAGQVEEQRRHEDIINYVLSVSPVKTLIIVVVRVMTMVMR